MKLDPFDRGDGSGSRSSGDDWLDAKSIFDNEWGSTAATTFDPDDTDAKDERINANKQKRLKRQYKRHNGKGESDRTGSIRSSHISNDIDLFISILDLPDNQAKIVKNIMDNIDISSRNFGPGGRYEKVILTVCSLVSDKHLSEQPNPSVQARLFMTDEFRELMQVCEMSTKDHRNMRPYVRKESDYFD